MFDLTTIFHSLQRHLFSTLAEEVGPLTALDRQFCEVVSFTQWGHFTHQYEGCGEGRPPCSRTWLAHAFIAKCQIWIQLVFKAGFSLRFASSLAI